MNALLLRLRRQLGWGIAVVVLGPLVTFAVLPSSSSSIYPDQTESQVLGAALRFGLIALVIIFSFALYAQRYSRSARAAVLGADNLVSELSLQDDYCLVLRTFGRDGYVLLPRTNRKGRRKRYSVWNNPTITVEEVVAAAAEELLGMETVGIVDQKVRLAPPGPVFRKVTDSQWQEVAEHLIRHARVIVLLLGPDQDIGKGFAWEIERIRAAGQASRVVVALPPPGRDEKTYRAAFDRACVLLTILGGDGPDPGDHALRETAERLMPTALTATYRPAGGFGSWGPVVTARTDEGRVLRALSRRVLAAKTSEKVYYSALGEAFEAVYRDNHDPLPDAAAPAVRRDPSTRTPTGGPRGSVARGGRGGPESTARPSAGTGVALVILGLAACVIALVVPGTTQPGHPSLPTYPPGIGFPFVTVISPDWAHLDVTLAFSRDGEERIGVNATTTNCKPGLSVCIHDLAAPIPVVLRMRGAARIARPLSGMAVPSLGVVPTRVAVPDADAPAGSPPADQYSAVLTPLDSLSIAGYAAEAPIASDKERHLFASPPVDVTKCPAPVTTPDTAGLLGCADHDDPEQTDPRAPDAVHVAVDPDDADSGNLRVDFAQPRPDSGPSDGPSVSHALQWTWMPTTKQADRNYFQVLCNYVDIHSESTDGESPAFLLGALFAFGIVALVSGVRRYRAARRPRSEFVVEK